MCSFCSPFNFHSQIAQCQIIHQSVHTDLVERLLSQVDSSSLSTVEVVVANARRALLLVLLRVRVKVGGFDSWLLGDAIGDDEALDAATRMDTQIAVSVLLFIGTEGGGGIGCWLLIGVRYPKK